MIDEIKKDDSIIIDNDIDHNIIKSLSNEIKELKSNQDAITNFLKQQHLENVRLETEKEEIKDPSDKPLTMRSSMELIHEVFDMWSKTQDKPVDPMQTFYLEIGRKVAGDTFEQVSKNVFAKPIAKIQSENIKNMTNGN